MADLTPFKFELGSEAVDTITGFKGRLTGRVQYITGCNQYVVSPPVDSDGKHRDAHWVDEDRLQLTEAKPVKLQRTGTGPDIPAPIK